MDTAERAATINWRVGGTGYVEGRFNGRTVLQHRFIVETLEGTLHPDLHIHHINGCKTDNRPGNLMVIAPGPHAWEVSMRSNAIRVSAQAFVDNERSASGGLLSAYGKQLDILLSVDALEPDDAAWQRIAEHGFWSEGDVVIAARAPVKRWDVRHPPTFGEVIAMAGDAPDKAFLKALHIEKVKKRRDDAGAVMRGGIR